LDEQNRRVKTDGLDARALCLRMDRFLHGNRSALALVRVPSEEEEQARALHRQREQLVKVRKVLEAQGRSLLVNHGCEPVQQWWKKRDFATLAAPEWIKQLLGHSQPVVLLLQEKINQLTLQLQNAAPAEPPRGLGKMTSVVLDREIGDWHRFNNRRQIASYTGLCPGEYSSGSTRLQSCVGQARQSAAACCLGGTGLENGPLPAPLPRGAQMDRALEKRAAHHRAQAQKSYRRSGPPIGRRSVADPHRPAHARATGFRNFNS
jgi:transposase